MRIKLEVYLLFLGAIVLALSITILVRHKSIDLDLLAAIGVLGGLAIILATILQITSERNGKNGGRNGK